MLESLASVAPFGVPSIFLQVAAQSNQKTFLAREMDALGKTREIVRLHVGEWYVATNAVQIEAVYALPGIKAQDVNGVRALNVSEPNSHESMVRVWTSENDSKAV